MIKWKRPSGSFIETNDKQDTIDMAEANGWERADKPEEPKPKRKRRTPAEMAAARKEALEDGNGGSSN